MDWYFGKEEFERQGNKVYTLLRGRAISKRIDLADDVGGIRHEAYMLNMDTFELLRTLEGMCYNNMAVEIDDSTYVVCKPSELGEFGVEVHR